MALTVVPPDFDGLQVLYIPVIAVPTVIFVVAALEPLLSMGSDARRSFRNRREFEKTRARQVISTLLRIGTPSVLAALLGFLYFDNLSLYLSSTLDNDTLRILANDNANGQFVQNFLISAGTLFAILAGNAYSDLYEQQERIFVSLYDEVTVAKLLLEQLTLVGQARPWYAASLRCMRVYVSELRNIQVAPIERLELKPVEDPLEAIMLLTSVGVPSGLYATVRDLRRARGARLGALQRKFPVLGILLLYFLAALELLSFPLLAAGTARLSEPPELNTVSILELQSVLFGSLCACVVLVLRIIQELWQPTGGVFNVDDVVQDMSFGLGEELRLRTKAMNNTNAVFSRDFIEGGTGG